MVKVLILGGTRFLGQELAISLADKDFDVTTCSRKESNKHINHITIQRDDINIATFEDCYDLVIDFTCYSKNSLGILKYIKFSRYIMISTTWIGYIDNSSKNNENLSDLTRSYVSGKQESELLAEKLVGSSCGEISIIRLPPMLGVGDHTKRIQFYLDRMNNNLPMYTSIENQAYLQISWVGDIANILSHYIVSSELDSNKVLYDAIPTQGIFHKDFLEILKCSIGSHSEIIELTTDEIIRNHGDYFWEDPFIRESYVPPSNGNLFNLFSVESTAIKTWIELILQEEWGNVK